MRQNTGNHSRIILSELPAELPDAEWVEGEYRWALFTNALVFLVALGPFGFLFISMTENLVFMVTLEPLFFESVLVIPPFLTLIVVMGSIPIIVWIDNRLAKMNSQELGGHTVVDGYDPNDDSNLKIVRRSGRYWLEKKQRLRPFGSADSD